MKLWDNTRTCRQCKRDFRSRGDVKVYCSKACKQMAYRRRKMRQWTRRPSKTTPV